ncbi:MAG: metal ABC transporter ATP-binding protein [Chloroflexi bacterium]|jgi:zinc transport system ATP-binding protein|nr:metal ABC transporter ATP-binding protein [Chloroflexota bacterium]MBT7080951.1 metal ABC transporter ATP-binding protein [Chloroflexota bacterium]MBT7290096.1 metal ABC transporter ATP-binding protein [Chloroflexota bacterium]
MNKNQAHPPEDIIRLENVWMYYNDVPVLEDINLTIGHGDFLGIIGPNGGGKTTLLKIILGLIKPTRGELLYCKYSSQKGENLMGYVTQHNLFDHSFPVSVWDVAMMGRAKGSNLFKRYSKYDKEVTAHALDTVGMLEHKDTQIGSLSGGQQQRVFIARALATEPELLLLDEPTASVDSAAQTEFYELLEQLKQQMAIVIVSHDLSAISIYVDKIACLNRQLFYHGNTEISPEMLEETYKCPVQIIAHGDHPHRVLKGH